MISALLRVSQRDLQADVETGDSALTAAQPGSVLAGIMPIKEVGEGCKLRLLLPLGLTTIGKLQGGGCTVGHGMTRPAN